ncbi:MAG: phage tail tape measure protein [Magnetococcales bacterium]|nr:phage tail tape measure protein [Magnetococcales bacterium]
MTAKNNNIEVVFTANTSNLKAGLKEVEGQLGTTFDGVDVKAQAAGKSLSHALTLDAASITAGVAGLGAGISSAVKSAMNFETAMAGVAKVVDFENPEGLKQMGETILDLSRTIPVTKEGLAEIAAAGGQLGVAAKEIPGFTEQVAKISVAFDMLPEQAGTSMAKLSNVFQEPITEIESFGDIINTLSNNTAAKASEIVSAMTRIGGNAKQFGLAKDEAAALTAAFIDLGKPPEVAATAINSMLVKMQTASDGTRGFKEALGDLGIQAEDLEKSIAEDAQGALLSFLETLSSVDSQERAGLLKKLFGMEYSDDVAVLVGSLESYRKSLALVADETKLAGSVQAEFEKQSATTSNQLVLLDNAVAGLGTVLGDQLLPVVNAGAEALTDMINVFTDFATEMPAVATAVAGVSTALAGLAAYKIGDTMLDALASRFTSLPTTATAASTAIDGAASAISGISGSAKTASTPLSTLGSTLSTLTDRSGSLASRFSSLSMGMKAGIAIEAAAAAVAVGALGVAMWEAESAETAVEEAAESAGEAFQEMAAGSKDVAALLDDVAVGSEKVTDLSGEELEILKDLISKKYEALQAERTRLELEEDRPLLGMMTDHAEQLDGITRQEKDLTTLLKEAVGVEKARGQAAAESIDTQAEAIEGVQTALDEVGDKIISVEAETQKAEKPIEDVQDGLKEVADKGITITAETSKALDGIGDIKAAIDRIQDKTVTITVEEKTVKKAAGGGLMTPLHRNSGGGIFPALTASTVPGVGDGDTVPASLPIGSYVIRKSSAAQYGNGFFQALLNREIPRFASGGHVPVMLTPGEKIIPPAIVDHYGVGMMSRINRGVVRGYADGGVVEESADPVTTYESRSVVVSVSGLEEALADLTTLSTTLSTMTDPSVVLTATGFTEAADAATLLIDTLAGLTDIDITLTADATAMEEGVTLATDALALIPEEAATLLSVDTEEALPALTEVTDLLALFVSTDIALTLDPTEAVDGMTEAGESVAALASDIEEMADALDDLKSALSTAAEVDDGPGAKMGESVSGPVDAIKEMGRLMVDLGEVVVSLQEKIISFGKLLLELDEVALTPHIKKITEWGEVLAEIKTKTEEVQDALSSVVETVDEYDGSLEKAEETTGNLQASLEGLEKSAEEAVRMVEEVADAVDDLEDKTVTVNARTSSALNSLNNIKTALDAIQSKTITITTRYVEQHHDGGLVGALKLNSGGAVFPRLTRSTVPGSGNQDTEPYSLPVGSWIINKSASDYYGSALMDAITSMSAPRLATGGLVDAWLTPGERFMPPDTVQNYGQRFMAMLNQKSFPKGAFSAPGLASGGSVGGGSSGGDVKTIRIELSGGGETVAGDFQESDTDALLRILQQEQGRAL